MSIIDIDIAIIGDTMTGKTGLIYNYLGKNNMHKSATIGIDYLIKKNKKFR